MKQSPASARRWFVSGRVQGVGFRSFVQQAAAQIGLRGWVRNEADGRVQVFATGTPDQLDRLAAQLYQGPRLSEVRTVDQQEASAESHTSFEVR